MIRANALAPAVATAIVPDNSTVELLESVDGGAFSRPSTVNFPVPASNIMLSVIRGGQAVAAALAKDADGKLRVVSYVRKLGKWAALPDLSLGNLDFARIAGLSMLPSGSAVMVLRGSPEAANLGVKRLQLP